MKAKQPWRENAGWVWDQRRNPELSRIAVLQVELRSTSKDLLLVVTPWLRQLNEHEDGVWVWGGFACAVKQLTPRHAVIALSSSGEDTFESLAHAARWLYDEVVAPHEGVSVQWTELPLSSR